MNTIFVNSENNKTPEPYTLLVNHLDKINLKRSDKYGVYQILVYIIHVKV